MTTVQEIFLRYFPRSRIIRTRRHTPCVQASTFLPPKVNSLIQDWNSSTKHTELLRNWRSELRRSKFRSENHSSSRIGSSSGTSTEVVGAKTTKLTTDIKKNSPQLSLCRLNTIGPLLSRTPLIPFIQLCFPAANQPFASSAENPSPGKPVQYSTDKGNGLKGGADLLGKWCFDHFRKRDPGHPPRLSWACLTEPRMSNS
ncbi:hypothetical protein VTO42DRAFT_3951 [Malbranchea cinnamomea]